MAARTFRSKHTTVEAIQLTASTEIDDVIAFMGDAPFDFDSEGITVTTASGNEAVARLGDWLIRDSEPGTFYPCVPTVFAARWEEVTQDGNA